MARMTKRPTNSVSNEDILYLLEKVYTDLSTLKLDVSVLKEDVSILKTVTSNMVGDIQKIEEITSVLGYHNSEHHIQLPAFA